MKNLGQTGHNSKDKNRGDNYVNNVRNHFPHAILDQERQTYNQITITVDLNSVPNIVAYLYYDLGGFLPVLFGNDERSLHGNFAIYYALSMEEGEKCWIIVKALVDPVKAEFPSATPLVPAAVWGEREIRDMYGLEPVGIPDARRLV